MNVLDLMDREHNRIAHDLAHALSDEGNGAARPACAQAVGRLGAYLIGLERTLFPALIAVNDPHVRVPAQQHRLLKRRTLDALKHCRNPSSRFEQPVRKLQQETLRWRRHEETELHPMLSAALGQELSLLGGELLLHLAGNRRPETALIEPPIGCAAIVRGLWTRFAQGRRRSRLTMSRLPVLHDVVQPGPATL